MGVFHCPMGAAYRHDDSCIECGLCEAGTKEAFIKASMIVREAIRKQASSRLDLYKISKIVVCGKGGSGKSTISALLARSLIRLGYEVLIIDTDESNAGLYKKIGFDRTGEPLLKLLGNGRTVADPRASEWMTKDDIYLEDIPEDFLMSDGKLHLLVTGKIMDPFQGCACAMSDLTRELLLRLRLKEKQIVIVDSEAGIESFGRGMERGADTVIAVVEPSFDSLELAERIQYMAEGIGIRRIRVILNKMPSQEITDSILKTFASKDIKYLGCFMLESSILTAGLGGVPVSDEELLGRTCAITKLMLDEAEMDYAD